MQPIDRIRWIQASYDEMRFGSKEAYGEALPWALFELANAIAFMVATAEFVTPDALGIIFARAERLRDAGEIIARAELHQRAVG